MANALGGLQGATSGAMMGANFGPYGAAIGGAIGLFAGLGKSDPNEAALQAQKKYNDEVIKNTATALFDQQRSQQVQRMQTARALQSYQVQGKTSISQVRAGMGAADLIGGSSVALAQAIDSQTTQALAGVELNSQVLYDNYLTGINQTTNNGVNSLQKNIQIQQQQGLDIGSLYQAGKGMYDSYGAMNQQGGYSAGLQFGAGTPQAASTNPYPSNYSLPSNTNTQFTGNMNQSFNMFQYL